MSRPSWTGQSLGGRYRIDELLGQGGMSAVYKAFDPNLRRVVAVKLIHTHLADDPKFLRRFEEEAAAVAQLRHPNIVQVFDFNHDNDLYFMVQEFVAGETLHERLRRLNKTGRHMTLAEALRITIQICDAVGYAHSRGLIHRDIKPANIMIDIHQQAILMDFGIVKITGGHRHTATGAIVGTALYLPPELIRGEMPDPRSDLYSLAVTLFEMLSGRPPFEADSAMTLMMMHLNDPVPDLRTLRPDTPASLAAVIEKALAKDMTQRYASVAEFAAALRTVQDRLPAQTSGATLVETPSPAPAAPASSAPPATAVAPPTLPEQSPPAAANTQSPGQGAMYGAAANTQSPGQGAMYGAAENDRTFANQAQPVATPAAAPAAQQTRAGAYSPGVQQPTSPARAPASKNLPLFAGLGALLLVAALLAIWLVGRKPASPAVDLSATQAALFSIDATLTAAAPAIASTSAPFATATPAPTLADALPPSPTPTITQSPTPTIPVGVPYARINTITISSQGSYVVDYETFEYTEALPGPHVHFFFNTVTQDQAGSPGKGPWKLYGGPRPFDGYRTSDRPAAATQMCALVANPNHSVQLNSGNCFTLPDVNAAVPIFNDACLAGPGEAYPVLAQLSAGQVLLVTGISPDEAWWTVALPSLPDQSCWLQRSRSDFSGDLSTLPLAEVPPLPSGSAGGLSVTLNTIRVNAQNQYEVEFSTTGYTPALPGTHMHFFFDIYAADQLSSTSTGTRLMYGGASPFTGYNVADRPSGANQICALVANPNHTVVPGSGNCLPLPGADPALTMLSEARAWPLTLQDSFADNQNNWSTGLESSAQFGSVDRSLSNGSYHWMVSSLQPTVWWAASDRTTATDFYLAATLRQLEGPQAGEYGLVFRKSSSQDYLVFKISNMGRYALYRFQPSGWQALIDWSDTAYVQAGADNRMEVVCSSDTFYLALNGQAVGQYTLAGIPAGQAGVFVGTSSPGDTGVWEYDDFEFRQPN